MERYLILSNEFYSKKNLKQKEIEKHHFKHFKGITIFKTNNKEEAEKTIKELVKYTYFSYDAYYKIYIYIRFELVKEIIDDEDPYYSEHEILGIFYPNYGD